MSLPMTQPSHPCVTASSSRPASSRRPVRWLPAFLMAGGCAGLVACILPPEAKPTVPAGGKRLSGAEVRPLRAAAVPMGCFFGCVLLLVLLLVVVFRVVAVV